MIGKTMASGVIFVVEYSPEGGFEARALSHSIFTEADTLDELRSMIKDAIECYFEEDERPKNELIQHIS
jgi:predicted RNase H-like HicB family nuclease